ncbi:MULTISPECIES: DUF3618 domain-containing protein [Sphingomonas]|uniref:DUF3618 domain-containing protein n=1 Tax=Sphingomonas TaxID=13687 RepID=UPI000DF00111|nr:MULTISPECIES: DUF3618 domain-containing protein [Sphingomonas]
MSDAHEVRIARARGEADEARARLIATLEELKARIAPKTLAGQAFQAAKDKSIVVADDTVTAVKESPLMAAGIAGAAALLIARKPLLALAASWWRGEDEDDNHTHDNGRRKRARAEEDK